jgi:hypothetical protein
MVDATTVAHAEMLISSLCLHEVADTAAVAEEVGIAIENHRMAIAMVV